MTNVLLAGMIPRLKEELKVPIVATLQGDDIFLESLPPDYREAALKLIGEHCRGIDGFIATSRYYADFMAGYLNIPRERIDVIYPGINLKGHGGDGERDARSFTVGYFARICPEKGLHNLVDAYCLLRKTPGAATRLKVSGWLGENNAPYLEEQVNKLRVHGLLSEFEHVPSPDHASKVRFLQSIDVLSVPTTYREPKGLYVLEAWANGVPVVLPAHGSFPELIEQTGGGRLVTPNDPVDLAAALLELVSQPEKGREWGRRGREAVQSRFHAAVMARETAAYYGRFLAT